MFYYVRRQRQQQQHISEDVASNRARILEQQAQFQTIERDITQINDIFQDLNMLVMEQGVQIGTVLSSCVYFYGILQI